MQGSSGYSVPTSAACQSARREGPGRADAGRQRQGSTTLPKERTFLSAPSQTPHQAPPRPQPHLFFLTHLACVFLSSA